MRVVFMGTPAFAVPSLELLTEHHDVTLVVTRPDRAAGRGGNTRPSEVKKAAVRAGIEILQPASLGGEAAERIAGAMPDVICVAAFGMLLPPDVLSLPLHGCINVHASLLPRYRGAAPIQRAILAGEHETGVSIMRMEEGLDTGPYALQRSLPIEMRYADEVELELAVLGAKALLEVLRMLESGTVTWTIQDEAQATYAAKIAKDNVALRPDLTTAEAFARVRAATRRAPARACLGDREVTVVRAHPVPLGAGSGEVCVIDDVPSIAFSDGSLVLDVVRPAGRSDMDGADWARGARLGEGVCWRCTR